MTYDLRIERLFDAPPEVVFDTLVDPDAQAELFNDQVEGWKLWEFEIDLRVGGTWTIVFGREDEQGEGDGERAQTGHRARIATVGARAQAHRRDLVSPRHRRW